MVEVKHAWYVLMCHGSEDVAAPLFAGYSVMVIVCYENTQLIPQSLIFPVTHTAVLRNNIFQDLEDLSSVKSQKKLGIIFLNFLVGNTSYNFLSIFNSLQLIEYL